MENFFVNLLKIIGTITFARPIMSGLSTIVRIFSLIVQINLHGIEKLGEKTLEQIRDHQGALLATVIIITGAIIFFFALGADFHSRILISIGGFWMIIPLIILATMGEAVAKLITLYLQTIEGTLKGFHAALLGILKKMGVEAENSLPKPELLDENKFAKKVHSVWTAIIPLSLVTIFCIFFPDWRSVDIIPIVLFILISQSIMADQWADISLEEDNKKLIQTAKTKRKVFRLISFGLTLLLFWTAYTVVFQTSAEKTEMEVTSYVNKASLPKLPVNLVKDGYNAIAGPVKKWQAKQDSIEAVKKAAQARADSLAKIAREKADLAARTDSVTAQNEVWAPQSLGSIYQIITPPGAYVVFRSIVKNEPDDNFACNNKKGKKSLIINWRPLRTHYVVAFLKPEGTKIMIIKIK